MRIVPVELGKNSYDIYIGNGLEQQIRDFCQQAGFSGKVYLGVVQNAPHPERAAAYIHYLFQR